LITLQEGSTRSETALYNTLSCCMRSFKLHTRAATELL